MVVPPESGIWGAYKKQTIAAAGGDAGRGDGRDGSGQNRLVMAVPPEGDSRSYYITRSGRNRLVMAVPPESDPRSPAPAARRRPCGCGIRLRWVLTGGAGH